MFCPFYVDPKSTWKLYHAANEKLPQPPFELRHVLQAVLGFSLRAAGHCKALLQKLIECAASVPHI
jgi:hypothetical protein